LLLGFVVCDAFDLADPCLHDRGQWLLFLDVIVHRTGFHLLPMIKLLFDSDRHNIVFHELWINRQFREAVEPESLLMESRLLLRSNCTWSWHSVGMQPTYSAAAVMQALTLSQDACTLQEEIAERKGCETWFPDTKGRS
jgi:hypothetical protein